MHIYSKKKDERSPRAMEGKSKFAILKYLLFGLTLVILLPACKEKEKEDVYPKTVVVENSEWVSFENNFYFRINKDGTKTLDIPHDCSYDQYIIDEAKSVPVDSFKVNVPVRASGKHQLKYLKYNNPEYPYAVISVAIIEEIELLDYDPYGFLTPPDLRGR